MHRLASLVIAVTLSLCFTTELKARETIGLVLSTLNNPFFLSMRDGAENKADQLGCRLLVLNSQNDPVKEQAHIAQLAQQGVNAILLNPTDSEATSHSVTLANAANIPVITLDRSLPTGKIRTHIASDNVAGGKMAGDFIAQQLGQRAKVVQLKGLSGTSATQNRNKGFQLAIMRNRFELLASQSADFKRIQGRQIMASLLQAHPDVEAVFAHNDEMALGALQAIEASGKQVTLVGFDGTQEGVAAVKRGKMAATIAQQPALIGAIGVESAAKLVSGDAVDAYIPVPLELISN